MVIFDISSSNIICIRSHILYDFDNYQSLVYQSLLYSVNNITSHFNTLHLLPCHAKFIYINLLKSEVLNSFDCWLTFHEILTIRSNKSFEWNGL